MPPIPRPVYVNLWVRRARGGSSVQAEAFADRDTAAADAASPSLYTYAGTLIGGGDGGATWDDLSGHGLAVLRERADQAAEEAALERGLRGGAGRPVL